MDQRAAIYARVSTDEQGKGYSLPTQLEACRKYAEEQGQVVVGEFTDDFTGTTLDRPALNLLRELVSRDGLDVVVCYEIDRLARKVVYQLLLEEELSKRGVTVEYVVGRYEATPEGQLMKQIRATVAEYERAKILERMTRGKRGRAQAGNVYGGAHAPFGYRYVSEPHKGRFEIVPDEAKIVRQIFDWYILGDESGQQLGSGEIARKLSQLRVATREDQRVGGPCRKIKEPGVWAKSTVEKMLRNETYAGVWHWNKRMWVGKNLVERPREQWIAVDVPAIITREKWEAARMQAQRNKVQAKRNSRYAYLVRGRLTCAHCGKRFGGYMNHLKEAERHYYQCLGQKREHAPDYENKPCRWSLRAEEVDALVWDEISLLLRHPDVLIDNVRQEQAKAQAEISVLRERIQALDDAIGALERQRSKLVDLYLSTDDLPKEVLQQKLDGIARRQEESSRERADLVRRVTEHTPDATRIEAIHAECAELSRGIDNFTPEDKERVLDLLNVRGLVVRGEKRPEYQIELSISFHAYVIEASQEKNGFVTTTSGYNTSPSCPRSSSPAPFPPGR